MIRIPLRRPLLFASKAVDQNAERGKVGLGMALGDQSRDNRIRKFILHKPSRLLLDDTLRVSHRGFALNNCQ